jgi:hypothetical protein
MKRLFRLTLWIIGIATVTTLTIGVLTYWRISTEWKNFYTEAEMKSIASQISNAKELNELFYQIHDKLHNNDRHKSILNIKSRGILKGLVLNKVLNENSWHLMAAYYLPTNGMSGYSGLKLGLGLENFVTPEKCFDFVKMKEYEMLKKSGYPNIKEPHLLKDTTEILEFILIPYRMTYYRDKENLDNKVDELKAKLN